MKKIFTLLSLVLIMFSPPPATIRTRSDNGNKNDEHAAFGTGTATAPIGRKEVTLRYATWQYNNPTSTRSTL